MDPSLNCVISKTVIMKSVIKRFMCITKKKKKKAKKNSMN